MGNVWLVYLYSVTKGCCEMKGFVRVKKTPYRVGYSACVGLVGEEEGNFQNFFIFVLNYMKQKKNNLLLNYNEEGQQYGCSKYYCILYDHNCDKLRNWLYKWR